MTLDEFGAPIVSFPSNFVSSWLPGPTAISSAPKGFQSNFPQVIPNRKLPIQIDAGGADVIVLNPGSRHLKLGFANQAFPLLIPHCLAKPSASPNFSSSDPRNEWEVDEDVVQERLTQRYRQSRKKPPPNIYQSLTNYNRQVEFTEISAHNDAILMEWTRFEQGKSYIGNEALNLNPELPYRLLWPIQRGTFNSRDYKHTREVVDDLAVLWRRAIECELKVSPSEFPRYSLVLVAPDSWQRAEVKACVDALLGGQRPFRAVTVIQESQTVCFGSGVSSALVVNCGAQSISVACVDEGFLVPESQVKLPFGGDEVTRLFARLLQHHEFPYTELELKSPNDWQLIDELKERCCTLNEGELGQSAAVFEFCVRHPDRLSRQFLFKMFEERLMAPLAMFESAAPWLIEQGTFESEGLAVDAFDCEDPFTAFVNEDAAEAAELIAEVVLESNAATVEAVKVEQVKCRFGGCKQDFESLSAACEHLESSHDLSKCGYAKCKYAGAGMSLFCHVVQEHFKSEPEPSIIPVNNKPAMATIGVVQSQSLSVDEAAFESLLQLKDSERIKRCAGSIILTGGSQLVPGFSDLFMASILPKFPLNPLTALIEVKLFPNARDLDARYSAWKGGAVHARLESTAESWITAEEWNGFGMRSVKEKISFIN